MKIHEDNLLLDIANKRIIELEAVLREIATHPTGGVGCNPKTFVEMARKVLLGELAK